MGEHYPVVIVGAGPIGLTLVNLLGEAGAATVQEPRAISIDDESLRTMQAVGRLLRRVGLPVRCAR